MSESTPLIKPLYTGIDDAAAKSSSAIGTILGGLQIVAFVIFLLFFRYGTDDESGYAKYMIFRDIMVMLLLGFGYLMTFLEKYGLGAVGLTMLVTAVNMEVDILAEGLIGNTLTITMDTFINAEFSAAALLISFGALIGRATPLQMVGIGIAEGIFYTLNKILIVFGLLNAVDVGGTITIHMFGAYFGLAASKALGPQEKESAENNSTSRVSDVFSLVGTTLLWVYWPSFVGATETDDHGTEMLCLMNTILSLLGSTCGAFYMSQAMNEGKFDAVHIQNSTLAGGVAVGATAGLALTPGLFFLLGVAAGVISVLGYDYFTPYAEEKLGTFDTCGVVRIS